MKEKLNLNNDTWAIIAVAAAIIGAILLMPFLVAICDGDVTFAVTTGTLIAIFAAIVYRALRGLSTKQS